MRKYLTTVQPRKSRNQYYLKSVHRTNLDQCRTVIIGLSQQATEMEEIGLYGLIVINSSLYSKLDTLSFIYSRQSQVIPVVS